MTNGWLSIYWVTPLVAWVVAQVLKVGIAAVGGGFRGQRPMFFSSGNMPSSHSSICLSVLTVIAGLEGLQSPEFGIMFTFTAITLYDAINVRRAVGEQGLVLQELVKPKKFYMAQGHRLSEVVVGGALGIIVGFVMLQIL